MAKKPVAFKLDEELLNDLDTYQQSLDHPPSRTRLVEDAIRAMLDRAPWTRKRKDAKP